MSDDTKIVLEYFDDKFALLLENVETVVENKVRTIVREELVEVKQDIKTIKTAVAETNNDLHQLDQRVTKLEKAAA